MVKPMQAMYNPAMRRGAARVSGAGWPPVEAAPMNRAHRRRVLGAGPALVIGAGWGSLLGPLLGCAGPTGALSDATPATPTTPATPATAQAAPIVLPGTFEVVAGRPGIVIGAPHGADTGTHDIARALCARLRAGGVFATGFWDGSTRQRINVNRPTEQVIGAESRVVREWPSERAVAANARYEALVRQAAQGPLRAFYEMHSNQRPQYAGSIEVSTLGVSRADAARFKAAFEAARDRLAPGVPRLAIHVWPLDPVVYPNYSYASSISKFSASGCAIEHPVRIVGNRDWRLAYAECLGEVIAAVPWGPLPAGSARPGA